MAEHLFLCGLSKAQRAPYPRGRVLHLHGPNRNVRLRLDDVRKRLLEVEPELLTDLAEIATYVFAADCAIRRGGPTLKRMGQGWRRTFRLVIGVRQPAKWRQRSDFLRCVTSCSSSLKTFRAVGRPTRHPDLPRESRSRCGQIGGHNDRVVLWRTRFLRRGCA